MNENGKDVKDLDKIYTQVQQAAYEIIEKKKATYYGIGIALTRLIKAILGDENAIMPISMYQNGEYGHTGMFIGVPAIINRNGIKEMMELKLDSNDQKKFDDSCKVLIKMIEEDINSILEEE